MAPGELTAIDAGQVEDDIRTFRMLFDGPTPDIPFGLLDAGDKLAEKADEMVDAYNAKWWMGGLARPLLIKPALEKVLDSLPELHERLDYAAQHYAPVISLFRVSADWTDQVMTPLSEVAGTINRDVDSTSLGEWEDDAREVYRQDVVPHQHDAARAAKDNAAYISNMLSAIGAANVKYAAGLINIVADVFAQLVKIVAELATVVGSPFSIQDAAELIANLIRAMASRLTDAVNDFADAVVRIREAENELSDHEYFPDGQWPQAVTRA